MIDSAAASSRFDRVMQTQTSASTRTQLLRITEFLEALVESESEALIQKYAPWLIVRIARLAQSMTDDEITAGLLDRLTPLLWRVIVEYPELEVNGICLGLVQSFRKVDRGTMVAERNRD